MDKKELRKQVKVLKSQYSLEQKVEMSRPLWKELEQRGRVGITGV